MTRNDKLLRQAVASLQKGNRQDARKLLNAIIKIEPNNDIAWKWYVDSYPDFDGKRQAVQRWLSQNPQSRSAARWLSRYDSKRITIPVQPKPKRANVSNHLPLIGLASTFIVISLIAVWLFMANNRVQADLSSPVSLDQQPPFVQQAQIRDYESRITDLNARIIELEEELTAVVQTQPDPNLPESQTDSPTTSELEAVNNELTASQLENERLTGQVTRLSNDLRGAQQTVDLLRQQEVVPSVTIMNQEISILLERYNTELYSWTMPYEQLVDTMFTTYQYQNFGRHDTFTTDAGMSGTALDLSHYVNSAPFIEMMSDLYSISPDNISLMRDAWYFVNQLDIGNKELDKEDTPQYPLNTLVQGHGDNDDLAILLASLLLAAPEDANWDVSFLYMDIQYPKDRHAPNHVLVRVNINGTDYDLDPTSPEMVPYEDIDGWARPLRK